MGRQEATRPDSDEDRIRIGEFPCYSHHAGRLARLKQVPIFKVLTRPRFEPRRTTTYRNTKRALYPLDHADVVITKMVDKLMWILKQVLAISWLCCKHASCLK